jgi:hypothetical protein
MTHLSAQGQPSAPGAVPTPLPSDIDELWERRADLTPADAEIGRASCRERVSLTV